MIIAVVNNKGGIGKTTVSINLSSALAIEKKKVLIIDLDPQAHSTHGMGITPDEESKSIGDVMMSVAEKRFTFYYQQNIKEVIIPTLREGLDIVPSSLSLTNALEPLYKSLRYFKFTRYTLLTHSIKSVIDDYDYIIIDCPPGLGVLTLNAINACDFILIPCETSFGSVTGVKDLLSKVEEIKGQSFNNFRILYSMFDYRCKSSVQNTAKQLSYLSDKILKTRIKKNEKFNQCHFRMKDIFALAPKSESAKSYLKLSQELVKLWGKQKNRLS
ncbi:MAG: ParA family protein [Candidatus Anammoxibacter sp.]